MPLIINQTKRTTWRIDDDKDLKVGDRLSLVNFNSKKEFARAVITEIRMKKLLEIDEKDFLDGHEEFSNRGQMLATYRRYYGKKINLNFLVKIAYFKLIEVV